MKIGIASVLLQKNDGHQITTSITQHWRENVTNEQEMRGIAAEESLKRAKPNMGILEILVKIIDLEESKTS